MRRIVLSILSLALAGVVVAGVMYGPRFHRTMQVGVGYVAHHMCACQHIAGRDPESCRADLLPIMSRVGSRNLDDRPGAKGVLFGGLIQKTAVYSPDAGCTLQ